MLQRIRAGTSGFRGVTNEEITTAHALAIGERYGALLAQQLCRRPHVTVGHDQRFGAEALASAVAAGFMAAGADVVMLGCVPTGVFCICSTGYDGGVLVTGSHMPPGRIGLIPTNADGTYATSEVTDPITDDITEYPERRWTMPWIAMGRLGPTVTPPIVEGTYLQHVLWAHPPHAASIEARHRSGPPSTVPLAPRFDREALFRRRFRVLLDSGNGTAGRIARALLEELGCEVEAIHEMPKSVPDRPSECRASSCAKAIELMRSGRFDLGACFDGDADRVLFLTADGTPLSEDVVGAIFARAVLKPGDVCVTPINSGTLIEVVCRAIGATVRYCRIGQPETGRAVKEYGGAYTYEASAKYGFPREFLWYDAIYAVAKMLDHMARTGKSLAELAAELPVFHRVDRNISLDGASREAVVSRALASARQAFGGDARRVDDLDGLRFTFPDDAWVLLRPSGTEPLARVYADAPSAERAAALAEAGERIFREQIEIEQHHAS
jgi:phosphomannomutase/phosphoglucomutase